MICIHRLTQKAVYWLPGSCISVELYLCNGGESLLVQLKKHECVSGFFFFLLPKRISDHFMCIISGNGAPIHSHRPFYGCWVLTFSPGPLACTVGYIVSSLISARVVVISQFRFGKRVKSYHQIKNPAVKGTHQTPALFCVTLRRCP